MRGRLGAPPLPIWGEGWGEGVRGLSRDLNPNPPLSLREREQTEFAAREAAHPQPSSMHELAAVDFDGLPGHEIAGRRRQEHDRADQVGGHLRALEYATLDA